MRQRPETCPSNRTARDGTEPLSLGRDAIHGVSTTATHPQADERHGACPLPCACFSHGGGLGGGPSTHFQPEGLCSLSRVLQPREAARSGGTRPAVSSQLSDVRLRRPACAPRMGAILWLVPSPVLSCTRDLSHGGGCAMLGTAREGASYSPKVTTTVIPQRSLGSASSTTMRTV